MNFSPCLLIPVYNHGSLLGHTLARLKPLGLPCLLVDDGSDATTASVLQELVAGEPWLTLLSQQPNQGKGVAVLKGIAKARQLGYSHAVQVDADGQHAVEDIPTMLAMAEAEPDALISGSPVYDESVPRARLYGRYVTHFWVWVETLSFSLVDSMCGFRVYPVIATDELARSHPIAQRMDFDTDIMVRLYWRGVAVRFLPTRVTYPEHGVSHFALWQDNLRISRMHTRLVCGMIIRLPVLLWRKLRLATSPQERAHWSEMRESGAYLGMAASALCYRLLGRRVLNAVLYPVIGYFFLRNATARQHSKAFLQRVYRYQQQHPSTQGAALSGEPGNLASFQHFLNFGRAIVDRIGSWVGDIRRDQVIFAQRQLLLDCTRQGRGGVILSSHLGNAEMCRALVDNVPGLKMNVLVFNDNAAQINRLMKRLNPRADLELIQIATVGPDTAMLLSDKINSGEFIVIAADRTSPTAPEKSVLAPFFGEPAAFPQGAFILAGLLECPVFLLFCLRQGQYHIHLEHFASSMVMPRRQRKQLLQGFVERYAERLQHYALIAPQQWFNFFDFWALPQIVDNPETSSLPTKTEEENTKTATQQGL